jgi:hypothetical protein
VVSATVPARAFEGGPPELAGRPHEAAGNGSPRWMAAGPRERVHRTRPTGQLARRLSEGTFLSAQPALVIRDHRSFDMRRVCIRYATTFRAVCGSPVGRRRPGRACHLRLSEVANQMAAIDAIMFVAEVPGRQQGRRRCLFERPPRSYDVFGSPQRRSGQA